MTCSMFARINRAQLLSVCGWSSVDLDNRVRHSQVAYAFGLALPTASGSYVGPDCYALLLSDKLVEAGFPRALAAQFVMRDHDKWWHGLERLEWPQYYPPPEPMILAPTKLALDEGRTELLPDAEIYLSVAKNADGAFQAECGTMLENVVKRAEVIRTAPAPITVTQVNLRAVYLDTLAAAAKAGVDLGAPWSRPEKHPEHRQWFAAVEVLRALSFARQKMRKPPGPAKRRGRPTRAEARGAARAAASTEASKA